MLRYPESFLVHLENSKLTLSSRVIRVSLNLSGSDESQPDNPRRARSWCGLIRRTIATLVPGRARKLEELLATPRYIDCDGT